MQRITAEFIGSAMLAGTVIGSGIAAEQMAHGNIAIALLANTIATAAVLYVIITALSPISGAHFNPAVTLIFALRRENHPALALAYILTQFVGCVGGAVLAHAMFAYPLLQISTHDRSGAAMLLSEAVASFALIFTIVTVSRARPAAIASAVALIIAAGYWWTASTSFANPAITVARSLSDTFAGVRPQDAPTFILAQIAGALLAWLTCAFLAAGPKSPHARQ
jgi:glycerol uptake facilitator-like aquaporin